MTTSDVRLKLYDWQKEIRDHKGDLCIRGGRQTGKSFSVADRIYKLATENKLSRTLIIASSQRQGNYLYQRVCEKIGKEYIGRKTLSKVTLKNGAEIFHFPVGVTGIYLEGLYSIDFLYVDEAIHVKNRVFDSLIPMLAEPRKRGFGWITLLSSTQKVKYKDTFFYKCCNNKKFKQIVIKAEDCDHISKEFLKDELKRLGKAKYDLIYNGHFDSLASGYFSGEIIKRQIKFRFFEYVEGEYYLGIDPARFGRCLAAFAVAKMEQDKTLKVVYIETIKKSSMIDLKLKTLELHNKFTFRKIFIDDGGVGAGLVDLLTDRALGLRKKIFPLNNRSASKHGKILKEDLYSNFNRLLEEDKVSLIDNQELKEALLNVELDEENKIIGTDLSEATVRACWCVKEKPLKLFIS